jgi:hypothetical protein
MFNLNLFSYKQKKILVMFSNEKIEEDETNEEDFNN